MIRIIVIAITVVLAIGGVSTALSRASDQAPGPAIVLDEAPADDAEPAPGTRGGDDAADGDAAKNDGVARPDNARSDDARTFTVTQPHPIKADDPPDPPDPPEEPEEPDEPEEPEEPEEPDEPEEPEEPDAD